MANQPAPDDDYSFTFVHPSNLEGWDPSVYAPSIAPPVILTAPDVAPSTTENKESAHGE